MHEEKEEEAHDAAEEATVRRDSLRQHAQWQHRYEYRLYPEEDSHQQPFASPNHQLRLESRGDKRSDYTFTASGWVPGDGGITGSVSVS